MDSGNYDICNWCGRRFKSGTGVRDGGLLFGHLYCSEKCKAEAKANKEPSMNSGSTVYVEKEKPDLLSGLFGLIWKIVKWILIILIIWFVYDNFIKDGSNKTTKTESVSSNVSKRDDGMLRNNSLSETTVNYSDIKQIATQWSYYHNNHEVDELLSLFAPQVKYYQANYSKEQVKASKEKLFAKYPNFKQEISNLSIEMTPSDYRISFDSKVWTDLQSAPNTYPSYLHVKKIDGSLKIVVESDLITDKNLSKKK